MNTSPHLWRNLSGEVVVATYIPQFGRPGHYDVRLQPAEPEDLVFLDFLKPETAIDEDPLFE